MNVMRWAGSKSKTAKTILSLAPAIYREYREPFCGIAAVATSGHLRPGVTVWLNDMHQALMNFWQAFIYDDQFLDTMESTMDKATASDTALRQMFEHVKADYRDRDCPLALWVLSLLSYGQYVRKQRKNIASFDPKYIAFSRRPLFNRSALERVRSELRARRTKVTCGDYSQVLEAPGEDVWQFIDPPYFKKDNLRNASPQYQHFLTDLQHVELCERLKTCRHKFLLTIGNSVFENVLYRTKDFVSPFRTSPGFRIIKKVYRYTGVRRAAQPRTYELIVTNYDQ